MKTGVIIPLAHGFNVSGVTTWVRTLTRVLAEAGCETTVIVHSTPPGHEATAPAIDRRAKTLDATHAGIVGSDAFDYDAAARVYDQTANELLSRCDRVCGISSIHADVTSLLIGVALARPTQTRVVAWAQADNRYDVRVCEWGQDALAAFAGVSRTLASQIRSCVAEPAAMVRWIPNAVGLPDRPVPRRSEGPIRLLYVGRLEHHQKRCMSLVAMSRNLSLMGVDHELTVVGDGPAGDAMRDAAHGMERVRFAGVLGAGDLGRLYPTADALVLPSRYEGLSLSMLEAMAHARPVVCARMDSGITDAIRHGDSGIVAPVGPDADEAETGLALARAMSLAGRRQLADMGMRARLAVERDFSIPVFAERVTAFIDGSFDSPPPTWEPDRPARFSDYAERFGSGSAPPNATAMVRGALAPLVGERLVVHGTGAHTRQLWPAFAPFMRTIVAFADDDPARWGGEFMGRPVIAPEAARAHGATHVIISSWLHEGAIWDRRGVYESRGIGVSRIYARAALEAA